MQRSSVKKRREEVISSSSNVTQQLKKLDVFSKPRPAAIEKNRWNNVVSIGLFIVVLYLFWIELQAYLTVSVKSSISIDVDREGSIPVFFNISLPGMQCDMFGLDFVDTSGENVLEFNQTIHKEPLTSGCMLYGYNHIKKVAGEFHVAFGRLAFMSHHDHQEGAAHEEPKGHSHRFTLQERVTFNSSHTVNHIMFGQEFPGRGKQPLDDTTHIVNKNSGRFQYALQVVPTEYIYLSGEVTKSFQFASSLKITYVDTMASSFKQPGIYFKYEFSPYLVRYEETSPSLLNFITRSFMIMGGVVGVATFMMRYLQEAQNKLKLKH